MLHYNELMNRRLLTVAAALLWAAGGNAYEIGTAQDSGVAVYRGFTFIPSSSGTTTSSAIAFPDLVPVSNRGLAFLTELELRVPGGSAGPATLHLFDELPSAAAASSGDGAFASAPLTGTCRNPQSGPGLACRYVFDAVQLDFDDTVFVGFSGCSSMVLSSTAPGDDYPAGAPILDTNCSDPESGVLALDTGDDNAAFVARFVNPYPNLVADYRAGMGGQSTIPGAPALTGVSLGQTELATIDGQQVPTHSMAGGVRLSAGDLLATPRNYLVVMLVRLDDINGLKKLLDVAAGQFNEGLYVNDGRLEYLTAAAGTAPAIAADTWVQIAFERSIDGGRAVVDQTSQFFYFGTPAATLSAEQELRFFEDDAVTGSTEDPTGQWARIRIFDAYQTVQDLENLTRLPVNVGPDPSENDNFPARADLGVGGVASRFRSFHQPDDEDWLYAGVPCDIPNEWGEVSFPYYLLRSQDPRFAPIVEVYPQAALVVPGTEPIASFGGCDTSVPLKISGISDGFIRLRNCPENDASPDNPINYEIQALATDFALCAGGVLITGLVTESGSNNPVGGVFIVGDDNSAGFSSPVDGSYKILVTALEEMTLSVVSDSWTAAQVTLTELSPFGGDVANFSVERRDVLFSDGLEDRGDPFIP